MEEGTLYDRKSLKTVWGKTADFEELAKDCVASANSKGGCIHIGIEDGQTLPPSTQKIEQTLADKVESIPEIQTLRLRCREDEQSSGRFESLQSGVRFRKRKVRRRNICPIILSFFEDMDIKIKPIDRRIK